MARVEKIGDRFCVVHEITGKPIQRKSGAACYTTRKAADVDKRATVARNFLKGMARKGSRR